MLELLTGALVLSLLHAAIPNHWAPVLAVARAEGWPLRRAVGVTMVAGLAHVLSTVGIGLALGLLGLAPLSPLRAVCRLGRAPAANRHWPALRLFQARPHPPRPAAPEPAHTPQPDSAGAGRDHVPGPLPGDPDLLSGCRHPRPGGPGPAHEPVPADFRVSHVYAGSPGPPQPAAACNLDGLARHERHLTGAVLVLVGVAGFFVDW